VSLRFEYSSVIDGRNVGQSNTITIGILKSQPSKANQNMRTGKGAAIALWLLAAVRPGAAGTDANAGSWRMIVLTDPTQISIPAPLPITDASYQAESSPPCALPREL
jgi:hypothetical protein